MLPVPRILRQNPYLRGLCIVVAAVIVYGQTIGFGFTNLDDQTIIRDNYSVLSSFSNVREVFATDAFMQLKGGSFYRPVQTLTFMIDAVAGGPDPLAYHLDNLILHVLTSILVLALLTATGAPAGGSLFLALLFAVHPIFSHAVAWVPSRGDLLIGCLGIAAFLSYRKYSLTGSRAALALHAVMIVLAFFSKETALLIPEILALDVLIHTRPLRITGRHWTLAFIWVLAALLYVGVRMNVLSGSTSSTPLSMGVLLQHLTVPLLFLGKLLVPIRLSPMPMIDPVSVMIGVLVAAGLITAAFKIPGFRRQTLLLGGIWFIAYLIPSLLFRNPLNDTAYQYAEHRAYLPFAGILIILGETIRAGQSLMKRGRESYWLYLAVAVYAVITIVHVRAYRNPETFFTAVIDDNPRNALAYNNRSTARFSGGDLTGALADANRALAVKPDYALAYFDRAMIHGQLQEFSLALADYDSSLQHDPGQPMVWFNRSIVRWFGRDLAGSMSDCDRAIRLLPGFWVWYYHKGNLYNDLGRPELALAEFDTALGMTTRGTGYNDRRYYTVINNSATTGDIYAGRGRSKWLMNRPGDAIMDCERALAINPGSVEAYDIRGCARANMRDSLGAMRDFTSAIQVNGQYGASYYHRGQMRIGKRDAAGACSDFSAAKSLGYPGADSLLRKYCEK